MDGVRAPVRKYPHIGDTRRKSHNESFHSKSSNESIDAVIERVPNIPVIRKSRTMEVHTESSSESLASNKNSLKKGGRSKSWLGKMFRFKKRHRAANSNLPPVSSTTEQMRSFDPKDFGSESSGDDDGAESSDDSSDLSDELTPEEVEKERIEEELRKWKAVLSALGKYDSNIINKEELKHMLKLWQLEGTNLEELKGRATKKCETLQGGVVVMKHSESSAPPFKASLSRTRVASSSVDLRAFDSESSDDGGGDDDEDESSSWEDEIDEEEEEKMKWLGVRSALRKFDSKIINEEELRHMLNMWQLDDVDLSEVRSRAKATEDKSFQKQTSSGLKLLQRGLASGNTSMNSNKKKFKMNLGEINEKYKQLTRKSSVMFSQKKREFKGRGLTITTGGIMCHGGIKTAGHRVTMHEWDFCRLRKLGHGAGGIVYHAIHVPSLRQVALKSVRLGDNPEINKQIWQEVQTMYDNLERLNTKSSKSKSKSCPYLVGFHGAFVNKTGSHIKMVMEFMDGGELQALVRPPVVEDLDSTIEKNTTSSSKESQYNISVNEPLLANIADRILMGLKFLHAQKRLHRDLKPANVLISKDGRVKISDYGIATKLETPRKQRRFSTSFVGTKAYMSPERLNGEHYSYTADVWSLGILVLTLMIGKLPFKDSALMFSFELIKAVSKGIEAWDIPDNLMSGRSMLQDFVSKCICLDPEKRATAVELLSHPWIAAHRVGQNRLRDMLCSAMKDKWKMEDSPQVRSGRRQEAERRSQKVAKHIAAEFGKVSPTRASVRKIPKHSVDDIKAFVAMCGAPSSRSNARIVREFIKITEAKTIDTKIMSPSTRKRYLFTSKDKVRPFARKISGGVTSRGGGSPDSTLKKKRLLRKIGSGMTSSGNVVRSTKSTFETKLSGGVRSATKASRNRKNTENSADVKEDFPLSAPMQPPPGLDF